MKKILFFLFAVLFAVQISAQKTTAWQKVNPAIYATAEKIRTTEYSENQQLFTLNETALRASLLNVNDRFSGLNGVTVTIPNTKGDMEEFSVWENSNFEPALQAQFPEIRSYIGKGITDRTAKLYFSLSPKGIETMILRADKGSEFIEPYTKDNSVYVLFDSATRIKNNLPLNCSTEQTSVNKTLNEDPNITARSNNGVYKTMRLALSCTGEYATYHGGTVALALAAMNATMTRVNGVYDIDLAVHLNIIANNNLVIYTNAATDPYSNASNMGNWNGQLQATLNSVITAANYDIGHLFGASGGGGDAGCIGCVCGTLKGSGITSPADNVPMGDNFDIDYVAHEMGHQLGGTHSYSHIWEDSGTNVEPASGSTIMGYAGVVFPNNLNVQAHSDDYFTYINIIQIQTNLASKSCPVSTPITNSAPGVDAGNNYTIPKGTPFILTGSAIDANPGDVLEYTWEQNDSSESDATSGGASIATATKTTGPTFRSFTPSASPVRYCPAITRVLNNQLTTSFESVSNVSRALNFTLTARDNSISGGQTNTDAMVVNVVAAAGPFAVTGPNTNVSWQAGSNQNVTWNVAGTNANGVDVQYVDIYLSANSAAGFPILLASEVPNDGSETITVPNNVSSTNRIMVKAHGNIFYDLSNANFSVTAPVATQSIAFTGTPGEQNKTICGGDDSISYTFAYSALAGFTGNTTFSVTGNPAGSNVIFSPQTTNTSGNITMTVSNLASSTAGFYTLVVTSTSGAVTKTLNFYLGLSVSPAVLITPANLSIAQSTTPLLDWEANPGASEYDIQVASDVAFTNIITTATTASDFYYVASGLSEFTDYYWRIKPRTAMCEGTFGTAFKFTTGHLLCNTTASTNVPLTISATGTPTINSTLTIPAGVTISDVNLTTQINHSWVSDLTVTLISPAGTQVEILSGLCGGADNINATFNDSGSAIVCGGGTAISGVRRPTSPFYAFNGESSAGTWTLRISDSTNEDGGSLVSWGLNICSVEIPLGIENNSLFNFAVYPNPNNGSFSVKSDKLTSDNIKMMVYDMRGRVIFEKDYIGNADFNENIQLNNAQAGVYLLAVSDGQNKEVKRIVVQ